MSDLRLRLEEGEILLERLLKEGVDIAHECGGTLACASCRVVVREGFEDLAAANEDELDILERTGISAARSRLACQVKGIASEIVVEIPRGPAPTLAHVRPLSVTPRAARYLELQLAKHPGAVAVRIAAEPAGCSGFRYRLDPARTINEGDTLFDAKGVRVVVGADSLPYVHGMLVDLAETALLSVCASIIRTCARPAAVARASPFKRRRQTCPPLRMAAPTKQLITTRGP